MVGLTVLILLSNSGPVGGGFVFGPVRFGGVELLFTPWAMIVSQFVLALPVIASVSLSAIEGVDQSLHDAAFAAGGTGRDVQLAVIREARKGNIETGIVLGVVLLALALGVNALGNYVRDRGRV